MSSEEDGVDLMAAFKKGGRKSTRSSTAAPPELSKRASFSPGDFFSDQSSGGDDDTIQVVLPAATRRAVCVRVRPVQDKDEYTYYEPQDEVERILRESNRGKELMYTVRLVGDQTKEITFEELLELTGGPEALQSFQHYDDASSPSVDEPNMRLRAKAPKTTHDGFLDISMLDLSSDDELASTSRGPRNNRRRASARQGIDSERSSTARSRRRNATDPSTSDDSEIEVKRRGRPRKPKKTPEPTRRSSRQHTAVHAYDQDESEDDDDDDDDGDGSSGSDILRSDLLPGRKRKRRTLRSMKPDKVPRTGMRQSDRSTRATNNMQEANGDDVYRSDSEPRAAAQKITVVREVFETLPRSSLFRSRHVEGCEVCFDGPSVAPLIYCQGCSLAYHKNCVGNRANREHLVTKVGHESFVLQCRRCINVYQKKDATAPDLSQCQDCKEQGVSCKPFRHRQTTQQEMKDREDNGGQDPVVDVAPELINNAHNVLFRCTKCSRAWHYHHLPPLSQYAMDIMRDDEETADDRFREYSSKWLCKECDETSDQKVSGLIAWRPSDVETYRPGTPCYLVNEDEKQYLIKWENQSYFRAAWYSGAWTWGVTAPAMRKAFYKREDGPKMRTEDAVPEEYLRIDIVLDIKYTSYVEVRSEEIDKARIKEVDKALIKYKGLGYEDAVWEKVPTQEDEDRWLDFVTAYNDWVAGRYVRYPKQGPLKARLDKARNTPFAKLEKQKQPENLVGGELMKYQIEGLNWLYYQWYSQKNGILADEMGLGKTIQVIGFMATLVQEHNCFPFLVVVPNSTCANWRREIKQWVPSLRVVAYFGSSQARDMAYKYEMYPEGTKELRCHVVVTSYEAAANDSCRRMFRSVNWGGLIIDEGQRLKNDKSQLYTALTAVKAPFRLLLTGTPLQNNARELFNLLQFLDETINAAELEEKYAEMTSENIKELHDEIRPFILRRTKAQVLTFLPPLGQIILPISMSHLQKQLYKSILSKSPELLKTLFTSDKSLKQQERANLSNILMQLRKCLCHPFVYSREIEERTDVATVSHRNLVEASAKLSLLEVLLPKLQERGHRVLIFSQFLDMLSMIEDFMDGMQMTYQRLDGNMGSLEKQKRIDQFNAPDSPLFAFLLSTRAGGVGINLATADTVIIMDPDWNPHQDLQAISRAHRIGQKKKVLCFQLMTRASVEEKIMQMGRKKMALDHVVVEQLDADNPEDQDVESILKFGAAELFNDDNADHDIRYDDASVEKLIDRSQLENTKTSADDSAESQFSFARIWANDTGTLQENLDSVEEEVAPDPGVWDKILKERQALAAAEALARAEAHGRGRRARMNVDYANDEQDQAANADEDVFEDVLPEPIKKSDKRRKKAKSGSESDTDFQADTEDESDPELYPAELDAERELGSAARRPSANNIASSTLYKQNGAGASQVSIQTSSRPPYAPPPPPVIATMAPSRGPPSSGSLKPPKGGVKVTLSAVHSSKSSSRPVPPELAASGRLQTSLPKPDEPSVKPFRRVHLPTRSPLDANYGTLNYRPCPACYKQHPQGACELKVAGVEHCGLCGLAHFGHGRQCPHIKSETQVREMLETLKNSPENKELVDAAVKYLRGVKGHLVQTKKREREKSALQSGQPLPSSTGLVSGQPRPNGPGAINGSGALPAARGPPRREVPQTYQGPANAAPGSVGSFIQGQRGSATPQQYTQQLQTPGLDDRDVESALRGYLGGPASHQV
ncbi:hypothetical protein P153DRAFT_430497 [Dothidotthia symphoricarpi CBS 119687]|uniref:Uncharacterized protein n=1 Tax=Dothidotthia symphoricarpi CBS 119687 TaxID=1392245 RepID=A0A6A6AH69_9PLEO|nr:uncharacterized protein P153DRAFT_430497 [Dothidotthia symphoricarpi CBS 119687]KAF2130237.1 hypothetical protein P153DRAFT_430497 [Dothidotthia symphoricarpi CBS 119687]